MAAGSLQRINKFALGEARTHKKFFIIVNIILGMGGLLYLLMSEFESYEIYVDGSMEIERMSYSFSPSILGLFLLCTGCCIGLIGASLIFRDMNSVQIGDVQLSLPMTANERFFSKILALMYLHIFPVLVWAGIPTLVNRLRCGAYSIEDTTSSAVVTIFLGMLAGAMFINSVTVLCTVCCGALAESIYFSLIAIGCLSIAPTLLWLNLTRVCGGQHVEPGYVFSAWTLSFFVTIDYENFDFSQFNCMLMLNSLISLIVMGLTSFIYRRRDARSVGTPIANRAFFEAIMFLGLATVYAMFFFNAEVYIGIIIVAVIYIVIHIITSRGKLSVKRFIGWIVKFGLSTAVYIGIAAASFFTGGFGTATHTPWSGLGNAIVSVTGYDNTSRSISEYTLWYGQRDPDDPEKATDAQSRAIAEIFQKYAWRSVQSRTFEEFLDTLNGEGYSNGGFKCNLYIYRNERLINRAGDTYTRAKTLMSQDITISQEDNDKMVEELKALGFLKERHNQLKYDDYISDYVLDR